MKKCRRRFYGAFVVVLMGNFPGVASYKLIAQDMDKLKDGTRT